MRHIRAAILIAVSSLCSLAHGWESPTYGDESIAMGGTLNFEGTDNNVKSDLLGDWRLNAALTGLGVIQSNATGTNPRNLGDVSNAQLVIAKDSGLLQFFAVTGYYSMPDLSTSYQRAATQTRTTWGALPIAYASIAPSEAWSLYIGKLFTLGGAEGTFSYENINIQRGLLWGQTNSVSEGAQLNYKGTSWSTSLAWTDGADSGTYNWLGLSVSYKLSERTDLTAIWNGALSGNAANSALTPLLQNNSQISNLVYSFKGDTWGVTPYLQYSVVPANPSIGINGVSSTQGVGLLATYRFTPLINGQPPKHNTTLPFRLEYMNTRGDSGTSTNNLLYGPNSAAWTATITPTWQRGIFFARIEGSYVRALNPTPGAAFGPAGTSHSQARAMLEAGLLF